MAAELVNELIDAGIHFGHRASRWNPKMKPYIFGKRNLIHIINVKETLRGLLLAKKFITRTVSAGNEIIIVGTKRQARKSVRDRAQEVGMHWVIDRWLGGTLTNFREIRKRITRLEELEGLEADGMLDAYSKKEGASLRRQMRKILRNLGGIRKMTKLPGAVVVIDQRKEIIAIREAIKLHIPVICLLDTDSDPDLVDIPIPGNDDAMRGIDLIVREMCSAVTEGIRGRTERAGSEDQAESRRRGKRAVMGAAASSGEAAGDKKQDSPTKADQPIASGANVPVATATPETVAPAPVTPIVTPPPAPETAPEPVPSVTDGSEQGSSLPQAKPTGEEPAPRSE